MRLIDMSGQRFGHITVIDRSPRAKQTFWNCVCDCGKKIEAVGHDLRSGKRKSCGCKRGANGRAMWTKHGLKRSPEYGSWAHMRRRCRDPKSPKYSRYGARGIQICPRWDHFENFLADMGPRPSPLHSIERVDNDAGYSAENCVWATASAQNNNKSNVHKIEVDGTSMTIAQIAARTGLSRSCVYKRFRKGKLILGGEAA